MSHKNLLTHFLANTRPPTNPLYCKRKVSTFFPKRIVPVNFVTSFPYSPPPRVRPSQRTTNEAERYFKTAMNRKLPPLLCCTWLQLFTPQIAGEKDPANTQSRLGEARKDILKKFAMGDLLKKGVLD
ncbi:hypothetical protein CDAR_175841 [Caerostris darwini]|uniref:Uncharacterized protein n=1 Tax=Caerostris darwini TaxID=1538125 RepID=A0AAV4WV25_9ARAC|nr:hypothetical protein CDAR_175841 [Caerostris darwini]